MSYYSDEDILMAKQRNWLQIEPFALAHLSGASYDVTLGERLLFPQASDFHAIDLRADETAHHRPVTMTEEGYTLRPGAFVLASTRERIRLGPCLVAEVHGKSSLGRIGLAVHVTAGYVDPGWDGELTLELKSLLDRGIRIYPGMPIAQLSFCELKTPAQRAYKGKYQGNQGPQPSRFHENWAPERGAWK